jgi:tetratricopeptide (TPR) repeat protein
MRGRGIWLGNLGLLYDDLNQPARAAELHEQAAAIARQLQDHRGLITRLVNLSSSYAEMGVLPDAVKALQEAAALCAELGDIASLATRLMQLGDLQVELAHTIKQRSEARQLLQLALENYKQALDTTQALGSGTGHGIDQIKLMQAKLLYAIGCVLGELGQQERAIECFDVAARFFASLGMQEARAEVERRRELVLAG